MCLKEKTDNFRFVEQLNKSKVRGEIMKNANGVICPKRTRSIYCQITNIGLFTLRMNKIISDGAL